MPTAKSFSSTIVEYRDSNDGQDASAQLITISDLFSAQKLPRVTDIKILGIRVQTLVGAGGATIAILKKKVDASTVTLASTATLSTAAAGITQVQLTATEADLILTEGESLSFQRAAANSQNVVHIEYGGVGANITTTT
jgi:hypothetical protein